MNTRRTFTLRVDDVLLDKLHVVADKNMRSANNQIEFLIKQLVSDFERENGEILLTEKE